MLHIKHVFFDLDHTLWDFDTNSELAFKQIFKEQNLTLDFSDFTKTYIPINLQYWKLYREDKITKSNLRYGRLKDTFDTLNYKVSDILINKIAEDYLKYLPNNNHLIEGTIELLDYLNPKYKLHIITNGFKEVQNRKLEASNIKKYFNVIVTSENVGVKKPNPKVFEHALKLAQARTEESIMIGDSYEADVMGSLEIGMMAIHCNFTKEGNGSGILSVNSLLDIKQFL